MHVVNQGQMAAALILAGVILPPEFNLEEAVIQRKDEELRGVHPKLDKVAIDLLAQVATAKDLAAELAIKKAEFETALPAGASAADIGLYKTAHAQKTKDVLAEIANTKGQEVIILAHAAAEAAVLEKHGLMRNESGALVPFVEADSGDTIAAGVGALPVGDGTGAIGGEAQVPAPTKVEDAPAKVEEKVEEKEPEPKKEPSGSIN